MKEKGYQILVLFYWETKTVKNGLLFKTKDANKGPCFLVHLLACFRAWSVFTWIVVGIGDPIIEFFRNSDETLSVL